MSVGEIEKVERERKQKRKNQRKKKNKKEKRAVESPKVVKGKGKLFGDSLVKGLEPFLRKEAERVQVTSLPGKGNKAIRTEVERAPLKKSDLLIIAASGNDLYRKDGTEGNTQPLIREVMSAVDDAGLKTTRRVVIGVVPRMYRSSYAYAKNISINDQLSLLCSKEGVPFVDPYNAFFGRSDLYLRDGIHLNRSGKIELAKVLGGVLHAAKAPGTTQPTVSPLKVTPGRSFASVVASGAPSGKDSYGSGNGQCKETLHRKVPLRRCSSMPGP